MLRCLLPGVNSFGVRQYDLALSTECTAIWEKEVQKLISMTDPRRMAKTWVKHEPEELTDRHREHRSPKCPVIARRFAPSASAVRPDAALRTVELA